MQEKIVFNEKEVKKIANAVLTGVVSKHWRDGREIKYICYWQTAGLAAPSIAKVKTEGFDLFPLGNETARIESENPIDIYVYANLEDGKSKKAKLIVQV
jgi:hypothetical protein